MPMFAVLQASDLILDVIDNVQKVSLEEVQKSHEEFNSTSRYKRQP